MPKVSVIIPAYNQAKYLEDALNSVRNQTFEDWECIIVNDGSTDNTEEIAKKFVNLDIRFKYIYQENKGLAGARNTGLKHAKGDFIQFLDSDDVSDKRKLEIQVNELANNPSYDVANSDVIFFWGKSTDYYSSIKYFNLGVLYDQLDRLTKLDGNIPSPVHCFLLRKNVFQDIGFFDELFNGNEDRFFWSKYCCNGGKFLYTCGYLAYYRQSSDSMSYDPKTMYSAHNMYNNRIIPIIEKSGIEDSRRYITQLIVRKYDLIFDAIGKIQTKELNKDYKNLKNYSQKYLQKYRYYPKLVYLKILIIVGKLPRLFNLLRFSKIIASRIIQKGFGLLVGIKHLNLLLSIDGEHKYDYRMTLKFIDKLKVANYKFKFTNSSTNLTSLYSSIYATMTLSLFNKLNELSTKENEGWANYIQSYQCDDGLFRDPVVANQIAETEDWWGWRHLTCHTIIALTALNTKARKPFKMLDFLYHEEEVEKWLESRDWKNKPDFVSNEILNYGTLLQYARDFHKDERAAKAMQEMWDWLGEHQDPKTGLWGPTSRDKYTLSIGVQTAYHIWLLYFYDRRRIQYIEKGIDSCLATQNKFGGFGVQLNSSACVDIDSIDPLVRFYFITDYRHEDIKKALEKAYEWVLVNMNEDGGFVFSRSEPLIYGHELMSSKADESAMFPTWFRTLSLAYISKVVDDPELKKIDWNFVKCPGYQFWRDRP